jgi:hypothetical protein
MKNILIIGSRGKLGLALTNKYSRTCNVIPVDSRDIADEEHVGLIEYMLKKLNSNSIAKIDAILFAHRYKSREEDISKLKFGDFKVLENEVSTTIDIIESLVINNLIASGGKILLFGSTNDSLVSQQSLYYHIAKSSIKIMVKWLAERLMPYDVSVNGVSMGLVIDGKDYKNNEMQSISRVAKVLNINKRPTLFDEVSELAYSITSLPSNQLTGETILMDGGFTLSDGYYTLTKKFNEEE